MTDASGRSALSFHAIKERCTRFLRGPEQPGRVYIDAAVLHELRRLARAARPFELCGLLRTTESSRRLIVRAARVLPNRAANPRDGFRLDRRDVARTRVAWQVKPDTVLGVFHTHGHCDARPSRHDIATMRRHPGVHVIIGHRGDVRVFASCTGSLTEQLLVST